MVKLRECYRLNDCSCSLNVELANKKLKLYSYSINIDFK